jgi:hypothetical protein
MGYMTGSGESVLAYTDMCISEEARVLHKLTKGKGVEYEE